MKKILFILLCILAGVQTRKAREPYVVFTSNNKTMTFYYDNNLNSRPGRIYYVWLDPYNNVTSWSIESEKELFETVVFDDSFADVRPRTTAGWFMDMKNLKNIEKIENLNTSRVEDMQYMFCNCSELRYLDLSSFNTAKAENMKSMFRNCGKLSYIDLGSFNTENVTSVY